MSALKRSGGRWSVVLGVAVLVGLFTLPAAAQFDPDPNSLIIHSQSIESETTFDLFENEYDFMLMPAYSGFFEDKGRFYTQLGNTGGMDNFQFGHYRPMGPGYFSFRVAVSGANYETTQSAETRQFDDDPTNGFFDTPNIGKQTCVGTDGVSFSCPFGSFDGEFMDADAYVGYGWQLSDNSSLGFGIDYYTSSTEFNYSNVQEADGRAGGPLADDFTETVTSSAELSDETVALIGEFMRRGDMSWRVRGYVQAIDHDVKYDFVDDILFLPQNDDEEGGGTIVEQTQTLEERFGYLPFQGLFGFPEGGSVGIPSLSTSDFASDVGYDGTAFGAEGDLRWEKNPRRQHQLNVGLSTSSLSPKNDDLFRQMFTFETIFDDDSSTLTLIDTFSQVVSDDIGWDNQFATWKTRWNLGDTHIGGGVYVFHSNMKAEVGTNFEQTEQDFVDGDLTFDEMFVDESILRVSRELDWTTFSLPVALEQDIGKRVQLRLGAQYIGTSVQDEYIADFTQGNTVDTVDPDGDGPTDPVETETEFPPDQRIDRLKFDDSWTDVFYNAGLAVEWDRVTVELLLTSDLSSSSSSSSDSGTREGINLDRAYVGATFKLGPR